MLKALILGLVGGVFGYLAGTALAVILGPRLAGIAVTPRADWLLYSVVLSVGLSLAAAIVPVYRATKLDPSVTLQEV